MLCQRGLELGVRRMRGFLRGAAAVTGEHEARVSGSGPAGEGHSSRLGTESGWR